jgi:hypothetical protein
MMVTTIRIKKAKTPELWYADYVGIMLNVMPKPVQLGDHAFLINLYEVIDDRLEGNYVWPCDCEILTVRKSVTN